MRPYEHHANYYETDQMGIIHHSNYIRWMEEARLDLMEQIGWGYKTMEENGIIIPVIAVNCEYKSMVHFDDVVCIAVEIAEYRGAKLTISYQMTDKLTGELRAVGESKHCFCNKDGRPIILKKFSPGFDEVLKAFKKSSKDPVIKEFTQQ